MSGRATGRNFDSAEAHRIVSEVRHLAQVEAGSGPDDGHLVSAVAGFVEQLEFWYVRVMREAVPAYRNLIIKRINPFIRRIECDGLDPDETAAKLVGDYNARNFVTAGGWALEAMAVRLGVDCQKSTAEGLDVQRVDRETGHHHLYVIKSGLVTRNSDILKSLKRNVRQAEKLLKQGGATTSVVGNYAIAAGKTASTFEDGIRRPSSAEFWSEMTALAPPASIDLALAVAAVAGRLVRRDALDHLSALRLLVSDYISQREQANQVDWEFIAIRNMQSKETWAAEDQARHERALDRLRSTGYLVSPAAEQEPA